MTSRYMLALRLRLPREGGPLRSLAGCLTQIMEQAE